MKRKIDDDINGENNDPIISIKEFIDAIIIVQKNRIDFYNELMKISEVKGTNKFYQSFINEIESQIEKLQKVKTDVRKLRSCTVGVYHEKSYQNARDLLNSNIFKEKGSGLKYAKEEPKEKNSVLKAIEVAKNNYLLYDILKLIGHKDDFGLYFNLRYYECDHWTELQDLYKYIYTIEYAF